MTKDAHPSSVRHSAVVRITHWINTVAFGGLLVSGIAILPVHPRLYWGETGGIGTPGEQVDTPQLSQEEVSAGVQVAHWAGKPVAVHAGNSRSIVRSSISK